MNALAAAFDNYRKATAKAADGHKYMKTSERNPGFGICRLNCVKPRQAAVNNNLFQTAR